MAPANLQGLNIIHHSQNSRQQHGEDILASAPFPDLAAQLDLWTNLAFDSDETHSNEHTKYLGTGKGLVASPLSDDVEEEEEGPARHDEHVNVVTGRTLDTVPEPQPQQNSGVQQAFDINNFLAGFGIDPYLVPQLPQSTQTQTITPSLAQLLSIHAQASGFQPPQPLSRSALTVATDDSSEPSAKRTRTRRSSISSSIDVDADEYHNSSLSSLEPNTTTPVTAAEDKRRRNTAASARFRLKKKEREAALETKAKELEGRVGELERECEGLRRENGWLKGLVVGVTGGAPPSTNGTTSSGSAVTTGSKRSREDEKL